MALAFTAALTLNASADTITLNGSGATFPANLYQVWFKAYNLAHPNVQINYLGGGSGAGVKAIIDGTVDFAGSDAAMSDLELKNPKVAGNILMIPMTAGSIVLAYNLPGVTDLKLSRDAYVGIFSGTITKWNDPAIVKDNPTAKLPDQKIAVAYRSDGSGTTFVFSKHLAAVSPDFLKNIMSGKEGAKTVSWPTGTGGKGNDGVAALITSTPGTIGYVEYGYAVKSKLNFAELQNKSGAFVTANATCGASTLAGAQLPDNLRLFISDPAGAADYPIATFTWILAYKKYPDAAKGAALKAVLLYCLTEGQKVADANGYIPLPAAVVAKSTAAVNSIQ